MKKIFCVIILLMTMFIHASAQESLDKYRIPDFNTIEEYQNLVGKKFTYVPQRNEFGLASWCELGFEPVEVTIKSITGKTKKNKTSQKMEWVITTSTGKESRMTIHHWFLQRKNGSYLCGTKQYYKRNERGRGQIRSKPMF